MTTIIRHGVLFMVALLLGSLGACAAKAQSPQSIEARHRADCRLAGQVLTSGQPANKRDWALEVIPACSELSEAVPSLWATGLPGDEEGLVLAYEASRLLQDGRVYEEAMALAENVGSPRLARMTALGVVGSFVRPSVGLDIRKLEQVDGPAPWEWDGMWAVFADYGEPTQGNVPLPADAAEEIRMLMESLAESDPDTAIRDTAYWWLTMVGPE